jgi:hypothetical protein
MAWGRSWFEWGASGGVGSGGRILKPAFGQRGRAEVAETSFFVHFASQSLGDDGSVGIVIAGHAPP